MILFGDRSKEAVLCVVLCLSILIPTVSWAGFLDSNSRLAEVSLITLNQARKMSFQPISEQGIVLVAIRDCSVLIDGQITPLKAGGHKTIPGQQRLELAQSDPTPVSLILIKVVTTTQPLTIETTTLARNHELEDASDRNTTLLIAIDPLRLRDVLDLAAPDGPWKSGSQKTIELEQGQTSWLRRGMHRLRNSGNNTVRFVTVEW